MGSLVDDVFGDDGSSVVLVAEHDDVDVEFLGALDDDVCSVVFGGLDHLAVHVDARGGELVDGVLDYLPVPDVNVVFGVVG